MKKTKHIITLLLLTTTLVFSQTTKINQPVENDTIKILFIGNSYSYFNSLSQLVNGMAKDKFPSKIVKTKMISQGGITLKKHWKKSKALNEIKKEKWDFVVLQEQSTLGTGVSIDSKNYFGEMDTFFEYARNFDSEIKKIGAKTVFYMTWAKKNSKKQQKYLTYAYMTIAKKLNSLVAPVGLVWDKQRDNNAFDLYIYDGAHPSIYGSYLAATTLFATIFKTNPIGLSEKIEGYKLESSGRPSTKMETLASITKTDANTIQTSTWSIINSLKKTNGYLDITEPKLEYSVPTLPTGINITNKNIEGRWYGKTKYLRSNNIGTIIDIKNLKGTWEVNLLLYSPDEVNRIKAENIKIVGDKLSFTYKGFRESEVSFILNGNELLGISTLKIEDYVFYNNWRLSKNKIQNSIDLEAHSKLVGSLNSNIEKIGYLKAMLNQYKEYGKLIGAEYKPMLNNLNTKGYNLLNAEKLQEALNIFELAIALYPESANPYGSYGEALVKSGNKKKALEMYTKAYSIAKKTNHESLSYFKKNMINLKKEIGN